MACSLPLHQIISDKRRSLCGQIRGTTQEGIPQQKRKAMGRGRPRKAVHSLKEKSVELEPNSTLHPCKVYPANADKYLRKKEGRKEGRKEGGREGGKEQRKEGRKEESKRGRMEGRMDGWMKEKEEGWMEGRKIGREEGRKEGREGGNKEG